MPWAPFVVYEQRLDQVWPYFNRDNYLDHLGDSIREFLLVLVRSDVGVVALYIATLTAVAMLPTICRPRDLTGEYDFSIRKRVFPEYYL